MGKYQFFVKIDKCKWFFKMLSVPLLAMRSESGQLEKAYTAFDEKEQDKCLKKKLFPAFAYF
jgi:hypothetical protein